MARQPIGFGDMFEQVAAEQRPRSQPAQAQHIGRIGQIGLDIDPRPGAHVEVDDFDVTGPRRTEQLVLGPGLDRLAHRRAAAAGG
jgi:hypothetical protein